VPSGYLRLLRRLDADVLHMHGNRIWCADFYFPFARFFDWPQLVTGHGFYQYAMHPRAFDRWYFERYFPRVLRQFDAYAADTEYERQQLISWGVDPGRVPRIPLGAAVEEFRESPIPVDAVRKGWGLSTPNIGVYVGGFFENKRVDRLIEAASRTGGQWGLVLIGRDVPESPFNRAYCESLTRKLGVAVRFAGELPRPETVASFLAADAVLSASTYEGFGVTLAEAMAAARPFIAWSTGAAPEMAATGGGIVVRSPEEFVSALKRLADAETRGEMGRHGRAASPEWSFSAMTDRYLALYERLRSSP